MKLSIIILNYRSWKKIDACLSAIFEYKPECEFEVIVVDNGSGQIEEILDSVREIKKELIKLKESIWQL
jgi:glycosyltransferase involved in cell wall biosynthesis